ncbi:unnamed protein product, partial [Ectocarpus fasciculatus]
ILQSGKAGTNQDLEHTTSPRTGPLDGTYLLEVRSNLSEVRTLNYCFPCCVFQTSAYYVSYPHTSLLHHFTTAVFCTYSCTTSTIAVDYILFCEDHSSAQGLLKSQTNFRQ